MCSASDSTDTDRLLQQLSDGQMTAMDELLAGNHRYLRRHLVRRLADAGVPALRAPIVRRGVSWTARYVQRH